MNAIASPPQTHYDLLNAPQHLFDLNADDFIDNLDLATFNTFFLPPADLPGDYNDDGAVNAADYVVWRKTNGTPDEYNTWRANFGRTSGGAGLAATMSASNVPEPSALVLVGVAGWAIAGLRRKE
jgi:hypothetical protein